MQGTTIRNNLFDANHFKCYKVNQIPEKPPRQKNFLNGLQNARNILKDLEQSIQQTSSYEQKLLQCKKSHAHLHRSQEWWELDQEEIESRSSETETATPSRNQVDLPESWSTVSIVCLQYQYEELSNRYSSLLRAYDERCSALNARERSLSRLRARTRDAHAQLVCAHSALLGVGERYLALRDKRREQNSRNEIRIRGLKTALRRVLCSAECARLDLDQELGRKMVGERDASKAILLAEMRKCNRLCLENMQLKTKIEDISSGFFGQ